MKVLLGRRQAVKALDFDSSMRRFESYRPSQIRGGETGESYKLPDRVSAPLLPALEATTSG